MHAPPTMDIHALSHALSSPVRLFILQSMGTTGMCVADLASSAGISPSTACHHLRQLVEVGLAVKKRKGRTTIYRWSSTRLSLIVEQVPTATMTTSAAS